MGSITSSLLPGTIVGVWVRVAGIPIFHVGIVTHRYAAGERTIISNSFRRRGTVEESLAEFTEGEPLQIVDYPGSDPWEVVVDRALRDVQRRRGWSLFDNCEHAVRRWHAVPEESPQLRAGAGIGMVALAGVAFAMVAMRARG
jgi:hypothetical protein